MALKENLVYLMNERKITIKELSKRTLISEPTLKKLRVTSSANPTLDVLMKITKALGVTLNELIENKSNLRIFSQGEDILLTEHQMEFIFVFQKKCFGFTKGTKTIFRRYTAGDIFTKYVISKQGILYEKIEGQASNFIDESYNVYFLEPNSILAYIVKEIYEVNYV